ncbi:ABC transporter ATP-binding protein [Nocardiopsis sp. JB363]|uniref:ABC transporter ATP-binding protein n=1 Tax=Nocardiopsis sp. JB363 TaxID=1434837 RepID=UPI00097A9E07|nr:ABC transporter ATP-binding protein [Nocardiopsis sp. JB363]SIO84438.1 PROBABLE ANTIBIOTIC-TRANSPORT ATP-BINDING PROTEIN ABC TRANSPORTER [Nocardiopsis sp. JB363]
MTDDVIQVADLTVRYRGTQEAAVNGMEFSVSVGEVFGFLGPSGAGKSTVQNVLIGLLRRYRGDVRVLGRPLEEWGHDYHERIGVGFELPAAFSRMTARENLAAFASFYQGPTADPDRLLDELDLADAADQRVGTFSKGMRMRLNLARALLNRPSILFLDEPTSGQDPVRSARMREIVRAEASRGAAVFLTTHDMHTAEELCDRLAFVVGGRIVEVDTPEAFKRRHGRAGVVAEYAEDGDTRRRVFDGSGTDVEELVRLLRSGALTTLHSREAALDEVFAQVTEVRL